MKRGEISMEVIIVAAIAILVLVILSVLVLRQGRDVSTGTGCQALGGTCAGSCDEVPGSSASGNHCSEPGTVCCIPINKQES